MFNFEVISIIIGLVFVYLLYSLLATIIQEIIATTLRFRAKVLQLAIYQMLLDETKSQNSFHFIWNLIFGIKKKWWWSFRAMLRKEESNSEQSKVNASTVSPAKTNEDFFDAFYDHPYIKYLGGGTKMSKPAYVKRQTFAKVVIDLLRGRDIHVGEDYRDKIMQSIEYRHIDTITDHGNTNPRYSKSDKTFQFLKSLWVDAQGDLDKFRYYLEDWFVETMERATGWYKKSIQFFLFFIGLVIAAVFNVDTLSIVSNLQKDPQLREELVAAAGQFLEANPNLDQKLLEQTLILDTLRAVNDSSDLKYQLAFQEKQELELLKNHRDTLISYARNLVVSDISKINNLLSIDRATCSCKKTDEERAKAGDETKAEKKNKQVEKKANEGSGAQNKVEKQDESEKAKNGFCFCRLLGWLLTALAISLGAPFWFDLLNRLMRLRTSLAVQRENQEARLKGAQEKTPIPVIKRKG